MRQKPLEVVFSLDSEDFLTPEAADAQLWWANELTARGIRASFQCVGELLRRLRRRRHDVIQAISRHEIGYHSDLHSVTPTLPQVLRGLTLPQAIPRVLEVEAAGLRTFHRIFERTPVAYCSPGDSWTPATLLAMAYLGVKVFCNSQLNSSALKPFWFCGLLLTSYMLRLDNYFGAPNELEGLFKRHFEAVKSRTAHDGVLVISTHPTRLVTAAFWDRPFYGGRKVPLVTCAPAPLRPARYVQTLKDRCRRWLDWLQQTNYCFTDFQTVFERRLDGRRDLDTLLKEKGLTMGEIGKLPLLERPFPSCLPSRCFEKRHYQWPVIDSVVDPRPYIDTARKLAWTARSSVVNQETALPETYAAKSSLAAGPP